MKHPSTLPDAAAAASDSSRDVSDALRGAFRDLLFERGYRRFGVSDIASRARVARSTFYEYFESKTDILRQSMRPLLAVLAGCVDGHCSPERVRALLEHFAERRDSAGVMLRSPVRALVTGFLADEIEAALERRRASARRTAGALLPPAFAAAHIAGAQLALIETWLERRDTPSAQVTRALVATSRALAGALVGD